MCDAAQALVPGSEPLDDVLAGTVLPDKDPVTVIAVRSVVDKRPGVGQVRPHFGPMEPRTRGVGPGSDVHRHRVSDHEIGAFTKPERRQPVLSPMWMHTIG